MKSSLLPRTTIKELCGVFGLILEKETSDDQSAAPFIDYLIELRAEMRKQKLFAFSDQIRDRLDIPWYRAGRQ